MSWFWSVLLVIVLLSMSSSISQVNMELRKLKKKIRQLEGKIIKGDKK